MTRESEHELTAEEKSTLFNFADDAQFEIKQLTNYYQKGVKAIIATLEKDTEHDIEEGDFEYYLEVLDDKIRDNVTKHFPWG